METGSETPFASVNRWRRGAYFEKLDDRTHSNGGRTGLAGYRERRRDVTPSNRRPPAMSPFADFDAAQWGTAGVSLGCELTHPGNHSPVYTASRRESAVG
ncbi:hypothetical protein ISCGN_032942 [Ixodes scapularis]